MKKLAVVMLLAVLFCLPVVPVFAGEKINLELIPKVGWLIKPEFTTKIYGKKYSDGKDSSFSAGADVFVDLKNNMFAGVGFMWGSNHKLDSEKNKYGFTNIYAAFKYKFLVNNNEECPLYLYPLVQLGLGLPSCDMSSTPANFKKTPGFYWGVGLGVEFHNIILEAIYGCDYAKMKWDEDDKSLGTQRRDYSYTAFRINIGYKFNL
jgi:hypothetical protein